MSIPGFFGIPFIPSAPAPVPFSQMRYQPPRMRSGWTPSEHALPSAAVNGTERDVIMAARQKRARKNLLRSLTIGVLR